MNLEDHTPYVSDKKVYDFILQNTVALTALLQHIIVEGVINEALVEGKYGVRVVHDQHGYIYSVKIDATVPFGEVRMVLVNTPDPEKFDRGTVRELMENAVRQYHERHGPIDQERITTQLEVHINEYLRQREEDL